MERKTLLRSFSESSREPDANFVRATPVDFPLILSITLSCGQGFSDLSEVGLSPACDARGSELPWPQRPQKASSSRRQEERADELRNGRQGTLEQFRCLRDFGTEDPWRPKIPGGDVIDQACAGRDEADHVVEVIVVINSTHPRWIRRTGIR